jgi:pentatricopeptide repeat protein
MQEHRVVPDDAGTSVLVSCCHGFAHRIIHVYIVTVFSAALEVYRRIGDAERAVRLLQVMKDLRMTPTAMHLNQVLLVLRDAAKLDGMISLLFETIQNDIQINGNSFEIVLEGLLGENRWDKALGIALEMEQLGFQPSMQTCVALISSLEQHRQYRAALAVFSLMLKYDYRDAQLNAAFKRIVSLASQEDGR